MIVMSIAGVDPSAGAGVFADLKTFQAIGVYGTGIVTALTAQNPYKFFSTQPVSPEYIEEEIDSVLDSYEVEFIKTGMMYSPEITDFAAITLLFLRYYYLWVFLTLLSILSVYCFTTHCSLINQPRHAEADPVEIPGILAVEHSV